MNAVEILKEVKRRITVNPKIWARGSDGWLSSEGPCCVMGHARRITGSGFLSTPIFHDVTASFTKVAGMSFDLWNDEVARGPWDVIAMLGKAIRLAEVRP